MTDFKFSIGKDPSKKSGVKTGTKEFEHEIDGINIYVSPGSGNYWNGSDHSYFKLCYIAMNIYGLRVYCTIYESSPAFEKAILEVRSEKTNFKKFNFFKKFMFDHIVKTNLLLDFLSAVLQVGVNRGREEKIKEIKKVLSL